MGNELKSACLVMGAMVSCRESLGGLVLMGKLELLERKARE